MKKIFLFIPAILLFVLAACQSNSYKISGTVENSKDFDSVQVFLSGMQQRSWKNLDSTYIKEGEFEFKGDVDTPKVVFVRTLSKKGQKYLGNVVLESGNIIAKIDTATMSLEVSGTPQNDVFKALNDEQLSLRKDYDEITEKYKKASSYDPKGITPADREQMNKELDDLFKRSDDTMVKYAKNNINSVVGQYIYMELSYRLSDEQNEEIIAQMDDETKADKSMAKIIERVELKKKTAKGQIYTDFELTDLDGNMVKLSDLVGKTDYLLIDFWASWCGPCIRSLPELKEFYAKNKGSKFDVVGVSLDEKEVDWKGAVEKYGIEWMHLSDLKGWKSVAAQLYAVSAIPCTVLVDKEGVIIGRNMDLSEIQELLDK